MRVRMLAAFAVVLLVQTAPSWAGCRCCDYPEPGEALARADAVFVGTVTDVEWQWNVLNWAMAKTRNWSRVDGGYQVAPRSKLVATLSVQEVFHGQIPGDVSVHTYPPGGWCGAGFEVGKTYLVYATKSGWQLWSGRCGRSREADQVVGEIEAIRQLTGTQPHNSRLNPPAAPAG